VPVACAGATRLPPRVLVHGAGGRLFPWGGRGTYDGPPSEMRSGEIEFTKIEGPEDFCVWHYKGDPGGHEYPLDRDALSEGKRERDA
jgi:hypothetical protein